jgi:hypothetical protein
MRLAIEYILCYSSAFGLGFIAGIVTFMLLHNRERRRLAIMEQRMRHVRRDNNRRRNYG